MKLKESIKVTGRFFIIVMSVLLFSCSQMPNKSLSDANIHFITLADTEAEDGKRILVVEGYQKLECPRRRSLDKSSEDYMGILLYQDSSKTSGNDKDYPSIQVESGRPLTLAISLSTIVSSENSNICYYQYHALTPKENAEYEVHLTDDCELTLFNTTNLNRSKQSNSGATDLTIFYQETEKQVCD
ncbi:hypothetical protein [Kangiella sp. HZ709]|uniref:hypothetical protein n=1 Tax=Kangiella sp. HZ709 TaxID=2666328 RepID=UPI0012AFE751|nr:hypothetical protein [Kangiella sp. HZ709]MRX28585.1 hypothetical protein [Kangiella sp. HZ709]